MNLHVILSFLIKNSHILRVLCVKPGLLSKHTIENDLILNAVYDTVFLTKAMINIKYN